MPQVMAYGSSWAGGLKRWIGWHVEDIEGIGDIEESRTAKTQIFHSAARRYPKHQRALLSKMNLSYDFQGSDTKKKKSKFVTGLLT